MVEKLKAKVPSGLVGKWTHAHERDAPDGRVFVGPGVRLGPSRGRRVLEFDERGGFVETRPGPSDRREKRAGRYRVEHDEIVLEDAGGGCDRLKFELCNDGTLRLPR